MDHPFDLEGALAALAGRRSLLVCPHDDPDPDALAAAWGMSLLLRRELGCETTVAFEGIIGRAENRAMVRELGIRLRRVHGLDTGGFDGAALVDTQPGAANHSVPPELPVLICVDHHARHGHRRQRTDIASVNNAIAICVMLAFVRNTVRVAVLGLTAAWHVTGAAGRPAIDVAGILDSVAVAIFRPRRGCARDQDESTHQSQHHRYSS